MHWVLVGKKCHTSPVLDGVLFLLYPTLLVMSLILLNCNVNTELLSYIKQAREAKKFDEMEALQQSLAEIESMIFSFPKRRCLLCFVLLFLILICYKCFDLTMMHFSCI